MSWVKCGNCGKSVDVHLDSKPCPSCGHVLRVKSTAWVKCKNGHSFEVHRGESKSCPSCGQVVHG